MKPAADAAGTLAFDKLTGGLREHSPMGALRRAVRAATLPGAALAYPVFGTAGAVPYFPQPDAWSCGFRNLQMLLASLALVRSREATAARSASASPDWHPRRCVPPCLARALLGPLPGAAASACASVAVDAPGGLGASHSVPHGGADGGVGIGGSGGGGASVAMPTVGALQGLLEAAWASGFDPDGAASFRGKVRGTNHWIGATEVFAALSFLGLHAALVDFEHGHVPLLAWLAAYFLDGEPTESTADAETRGGRGGGGGGDEPCRAWAAAWAAGGASAKPPVFLQHQKHSRTVVGCARAADGSLALLVLDPGKPPAGLKGASGSGGAWRRAVVVEGRDLAKHSQYQLVHVLASADDLTPTERDVAKNPARNVVKR